MMIQNDINYFYFQECISICGYDGDLMRNVQDHLSVMLHKWHDIPRTEFAEHLILSDDFAGNIRSTD